MTVQTPREEANDMVETLRYDPLKRLERSGEYVDACLAEVHAAVPRDVLQEPLVPPPASSRSPRSSRSPLRTMPLAAPPSLAGDDVDALLASAPAPDSSSARKPAPFARTAQFARRTAAPKVLVVERRGLSPAWLAFAVIASAVTVAVAVRVLGGPFAQGSAAPPSSVTPSPVAEGATLAPEPAALAPQRAIVAPTEHLAPAAAPTPIVATVVAPAAPAEAADAKSVARAAAPATPPVAATKVAKGPHEAASPSKAPHAPAIAAEPHAASKARPAAAPVLVAKEPSLSGEARSEKAARPKAKPREPAPDQSLGDAQLNAAFR